MSQSEGTQIASGIFTGKMDATTTVGCFSQPTPLVDHGSYGFQSSGNCQKICYALEQPVMGLTSGTNCSCGSLLPPKDSQVDDEKCSTGCVGFNKESCGGADLWWVILTGYSRNQIANIDPQFASSKSSSLSVITIGRSTTVVTVPNGEQTSSSKTAASSGGGGSKAGIAAGVAIGVVVLIAMIAGVFLLLRRRKRRQEEEEFNQKQSVSQFVQGGRHGGNSQTSMNDTRLDPEVMMSRRQSDGSIADNQDYSRRILRVANPEMRSPFEG